MKKLSSIICLIVLTSFFAAPASKAATKQISALMTKFSATENEITATYQLPMGCRIGSEQLIILDSKNVSITSKYYPAGDEVLTALILSQTEDECTNPAASEIKTKTFPNPTGYKNIVAFQIGEITKVESPEVKTAQTQRDIRFVAMVQSGTGRYPFTLEELNYVAGQPVKRTVLGDKGINAILGQRADGLIVKTDTKSKVLTWLVTTKEWKLISDKVIYIEPGVLTPDNRFLIGRKVADAPSTKIVSQDLKIGSLTTIFDTKKNGQGFVCGAYPDPSGNFAYFSHISPKKTNVYRIDLKTKKITLLGHAVAGFCISSVTPNGHLAGIVRDKNYNVKAVLVANEKNPDNARYLSTGLPGGGFNVRIGSDAGPYTLVTKDLFAVVTEGASDLYLIGFPDVLGAPPTDSRWEGPVKAPTFLQFMRLLPSSWEKTEARAIQP